MRPVKMEDCWVMRREAKVSPMMMPRYFPRSPINIFRAIKYMESLPFTPTLARGSRGVSIVQKLFAA
jgi:hypothetical protein